MRIVFSNTIGHKGINLGGSFVALFACVLGFTLAAPCMAAESAMPEILVFDAVVNEGISKELAASATKAVKTYFRETRRVEATVINRESPTVLRAILEKALTLESLASYSTREQRVEVAKALGYAYAAGAEISIEKEPRNLIEGAMPPPPKGIKVGEDEKSKKKVNFLQVKIWLTRIEGKPGQWESAKSSMITGSSAIEIDNAMQSAVSAAVIELSKQAFAKIKPQDESAITGETSMAVESQQLPATTAPNASDYTSQAEKSMSEGNLAQAIQQFEHAVSADPTNGSLRVKLAEAYGRKGLYEQAKSELDRAEKIGIDKTLIDASRANIAKMESGIAQTTPPATKEPKIVKTPPVSIHPPVTIPVKRPKKPAAMAEDKLREGDGFWNQGKPDEAALAYTEAAAIYPADWRSYERLAAVNASMSLFGEARKAIEQLKAAQPNPPVETVAKRYEMFRKSFDRSFVTLLNQLEDDSANFSKKIITRESYYSSVNGLGIRLEMLTKFLDSLSKPASRQPAALRRSLACGLLAQASASLLEYLESNDKKAKQNAELFIDQAKKEAEAAAKLDVAPVPNPVVTPPDTAPADTGGAAEPSPGM
ncbi:MAG: tetratricopeptide repeat protein [Armatimonadetes bacterium]|nr:tetratricopeptide repeat protein [Armatimonadota bacterium]